VARGGSGLAVREREEGLRTGARWRAAVGLGQDTEGKRVSAGRITEKNYGSTHRAMHNGDGGCDSGCKGESEQI